MNFQKSILPALFFFAICFRSNAQIIAGKPKNSNEAVGRILHEQKIWQQKQLPKNSVQYKLSPPLSYTYTFNQQQKPLLLDIKLPGNKIYSNLHITGYTNSHPYAKYYPAYTGRLSFSRKFTSVKPLQ